MQSGPNQQQHCLDAVYRGRLLALYAGELTLIGEGPENRINRLVLGCLNEHT